jgi:hypothetical protein
MFSVPLKTYFHRHNASLDKTMYHDKLGSYFGGVMTLLFVSFMVYYSGVLVIQMQKGDNDIINMMTMTNQFDQETYKVNVSHHAFMPYLQLEKQDLDSEEVFDIWETNNQTGK